MPTASIPARCRKRPLKRRKLFVGLEFQKRRRQAPLFCLRRLRQKSCFEILLLLPSKQSATCWRCGGKISLILSILSSVCLAGGDPSLDSCDPSPAGKPDGRHHQPASGPGRTSGVSG